MTIIYAIWFPEAHDRSVYVGLTNHFDKRCREHLYEMKRDTKRIVYKWMRRRIEDGFKPQFDILEHCPIECADNAEITWQKWFTFCDWIPKHQKGGAHQVGWVITDEHRKNMSEAAKRRIRKPHSEETKAKLSAAWTEKRLTEHIERVKTDEWRQKVSEGVKKAYADGRKKPISPKDICKNGHKRTGDNTYISPAGARQCLECKAEASARRKDSGPRCAIEDCMYPRHARGFCSTHYSQWKKENKQEK